MAQLHRSVLVQRHDEVLEVLFIWDEDVQDRMASGRCSVPADASSVLSSTLEVGVLMLLDAPVAQAVCREDLRLLLFPGLPDVGQD